MYKIGVIGDYDSIYGFAALGLAVFPAADASEGASLLKRLTADGYTVIYMTEALAAALSEEVAAYDETALTAVIPIPGISGNTGSGMAMVRRCVERAVGSDIIFKND
ncbi:MAG: V-type ATP synthase subunit F [Lachnospiraceae bacterium]|nr:V-type ATP synthase subunit F [Lachnospiraceae bacterium]